MHHFKALAEISNFIYTSFQMFVRQIAQISRHPRIVNYMNRTTATAHVHHRAEVHEAALSKRERSSLANQACADQRTN